MTADGIAPAARPEENGGWTAKLSTIIATSFGAGFVPKAPGHSGTLTAVPLAWWLGHFRPWGYSAGLIVVCVVGTWAAEQFGRRSGREDDQRIVIDEVAGYLVTLWPVATDAVNLTMGFVLFRLFDIWKPQPVRWLDRHVPGGLGVMLDDLAAGVYAGLCLWAFDHTSLYTRALAWVHSWS